MFTSRKKWILNPNTSIEFIKDSPYVNTSAGAKQVNAICVGASSSSLTLLLKFFILHVCIVVVVVVGAPSVVVLNFVSGLFTRNNANRAGDKRKWQGVHFNELLGIFNSFRTRIRITSEGDIQEKHFREGLVTLTYRGRTYEISCTNKFCAFLDLRCLRYRTDLFRFYFS